MYAYCGNNPINRFDDNGASWQSIWNNFKQFVRSALHIGNTLARKAGVDTAGVGAFFLNMSKDSKGVYHASPNCWQQHFGYNNFYDTVFDIGTDMKSAKFQFTYGGTSYMIWAWKGDYINLGAGAEIGIYYGGGPQWHVNKSLAMNMSMTLKYKGSTIISYSATTWWLTGFNPRYLNVNSKNLTATFTITFNSSGMYNAFYGRWKGTSGWTFNAKKRSATYTF